MRRAARAGLILAVLGAVVAVPTDPSAAGTFTLPKVRPAPVLPLVPVKAVVVLRHNEAKNADGAAVIQHRSELFVLTDSKTAAAFTKLMGQSAPKLAEQGLGQLQIFFSGLTWYLDRHPDQIDQLLK